MKTKIVEVTQGAEVGFNWGKFLIGIFDADEWRRPSALVARLAESDPETYTAAHRARSLLAQRGWTRDHIFVLDIETGEGAVFSPGGSPSADLTKKAIWVCPMYEPLLTWLYDHIGSGDRSYDEGGVPAWFDTLPELVELPDAPAAMAGYRRPGREGAA